MDAADSGSNQRSALDVALKQRQLATVPCILFPSTSPSISRSLSQSLDSQVPPTLATQSSPDTSVSQIDLSYNQITSFESTDSNQPATWHELPHLWTLNLSHNPLLEPLDRIFDATTLRVLDISHLRIANVSSKILQLQLLEELYLDHNELAVCSTRKHIMQPITTSIQCVDAVCGVVYAIDLTRSQPIGSFVGTGFVGQQTHHQRPGGDQSLGVWYIGGAVSLAQQARSNT
jgi:hypothetical protein